MSNSVETVGEVAIYECPFESIDASNTTDFKRELQDGAVISKHVLLDLCNVQFVDSAGLGSMVWMFRKLSSEGGDMRICNVNGSVRALFELVRMHKLVNVFETREEALASF